jgi:hypothetical protein
MKNDELVLLENREILHIVSRHSVCGTLRASDTPSNNVVVWFDSLTVGPTVGATLEETTRIRKKFFLKLSKSSSLDSEPPPPSYAQRNRVLRHCAEWREVALWFGPSMMEQFSLLQILAAIAEQDLRKTRLTLVTCPKLALGVYRPEEMSESFKARNIISHKRIELAKRTWELYSGPNPVLLFNFAKRHVKSAPVLCDALFCQLESYPSVRNGLSISEQALLQEVERRGTVVRAVGHVLGNDDKFRIGDVELFDSLLAFLTCENPLIEPTEGGTKIKSFADFRKLAVKLSTVGREVLSGQSDNVILNGLNRWIGGVHLEGKKSPWRWDSEKRLLKPS